ncbi:MAG: LamG-like jellyroll fold domain-containing protein [Flavobacteriales bacterium]
MKNFFLHLLFVTVFSSTLSAQTTTGLVAKYSFSGNANDEVGTLNGQVVGATLTTDRFGNANSAYNFVNNHYITLPDAPVLKSNVMTISMWVKVNGYNSGSFSINGIYSLINKSASAYIYNFIVGVNSSTDKYFSTSEMSFTQQVINSTSTSNNGNWEHLVVMMDDDSLKMYVNNTLEFSMFKGFTSTFTSDSIFIGGTGHDTYTGYFNGNIDDIRIYNRILNAQEVDGLYNEPNPATVGVGSIFALSASLNVFPNPASDLLKINLSDTGSVEVYSLDGRLIECVQALSNELSLPVHRYQSGVYTIRFVDRSGAVSYGKFVKS